MQRYTCQLNNHIMVDYTIGRVFASPKAKTIVFSCGCRKRDLHETP